MRLNGSRTLKWCPVSLPYCDRVGHGPIPMCCLGLANGLATLCIGLSVDLPHPALFGGSMTCKCSEDPRRCLHSLVSCPNVEYLLSSSLSAAVKLFTNCKGTTVPYFFITRSIYVFITLEISCTFMLLYQLNTIISYTSIVLLLS